MLWRAAGCPEPYTEENPFTDVPAGRYYTEAVLWAMEMGITRGTSESSFRPDRVCTRAELVTFLWRSQYEPSPENPDSPFTDVDPDSYYSDAVLWAAERGLAKGTGSGLFHPLRDCRRADAVTFVFRAAALE